MTRRELMRVAPGALAALGLRAQEELISYPDYARCLPDYLRSLAAEAYERRSKQIAALKTPAAVELRQQFARQTFLKLAGGMPERTPLNLRTTGAFERDRYRVEKVLYEPRPGEWISANLYIPKSGAPPFPAVLFQCGHSPNGKASDTYQRCCQGLVQLGFVVLTFDPMGQGERTNYPGPDGLTRLGAADFEHTVPGRQLLLMGDSATRILLHDAVRSLDVLAAHPLVDAKRMGGAGQSGGGTLTMMLAAVDDRIAAAVVSSGNTENIACADFHPPGSVDDAEQNFIGAGPAGFDRWDLLWPFAPRPLLILSSAKDWFDVYSPSYETNGIEEYGRLQLAYSVLERASYLHRIELPLPHGLAYSFRLELYRWLARWLQQDAPLIEREPPVAPEPDRALWATQSGLVTRDLGSRTPWQAARASAAAIPIAFGRPDLRRLLAIEPSPGPPLLHLLNRVPSGHCDILAVDAGIAAHVRVAAWIFAPRRSVDRIIIFLDPQGRSLRTHEGDLYDQLSDRAIVCAADLRGFGDLRPEFSPGEPEYARDHQKEEDYAWSSLVFGRSLLGQRVTDLVGLIEAIRSEFPKATRIAVAARGELTIPALCAFFLDAGISDLHLSGHLISWRNIVETELYTHEFANFAPDILRHTDLPQLAAVCSPRRIVMAGTVDAAGRLCDSAEVRQTYTGVHIEVKNAEEWSSKGFVYLL